MSGLSAYKKEIITGIVIGFLLFFFLKVILPLFTPFLLAYLTIYAMYPLLYKVEKKWKINKTVTAIILMLLFFVVLFSFLWLIFFLTEDSMEHAVAGIGRLFQDMEITISRMAVMLQNRFHIDGNELELYLSSQLREFMNSIKSAALPDMMKNSFVCFRRILPVIAFIGIYLIATILFTKDFDKIMEQVHRIGALDAVMNAINGLLHTITTYLKAQLIIILVIVLICCIGLRISGITGSYLLGILAGLLDALPFIGTGIILIPTAVFQLISGNIVQAVVCTVLYIICIGARELLEPKLMGKSLGIYPVVLLLSIYAGIRLFGISGIIKGPLGVVMFKQLFLRIFPVKS